MHVSTGERQEWMETLQTATRPPACGSQKRSDSLPRPSSTNKRGLLELRGYKGRVLVSLAGSKVRLCKTEQVLPAPPGLPLYRMTASCLKRGEKKGIIAAYLKRMRRRWRCSWKICSWMRNAKSKYTCVKMFQGILHYFWCVRAHASTQQWAALTAVQSYVWKCGERMNV